MKKLIKFIKKPKLIILYLASKGFFNKMNDQSFLKMIYRIRIGKKLNLTNPETFNAKLQWLKLYNRKEHYTKMVDKYDAKNYVGNIIGNEYIIPTYSIYNTFDEINFDSLPEKFVIKCTHDSGGLVICKDKSNFNITKAKNKINNSLKRNYYYSNREWVYKNIKPRIIIEKYMEDKNNDDLADYKVMCFNGEPKMTFTCTDRFTNGLKVTFFDLKWNKLPFERHYPYDLKNIKKPVNYNKMIELSKKLAKDIPFVRVDWYEINGKLYFGELTFFPGSGFEEFTPEIWDYKIGNYLDISKVKQNEQ